MQLASDLPTLAPSPLQSQSTDAISPPLTPLPPSNTKRWIAVAPALVVPLIGALAYILGAEDSKGVQALYGATKIFILVWPFLMVGLLLRLRTSPLRDSLPPLRCNLGQLGVGAGIGLGIVASSLALIFGLTPLRNLLMEAVPNIRAQTEHMGVMGWFIPFALIISLAHSLLEELYWRWFCYGQLRELLVRPLAHLIAGIGFAAHHVVVLAQFFPTGIAFLLGGSVALGGVIWSLLYQRQGTLSGAWISHMIVDLGIFGLGYWLLF